MKIIIFGLYCVFFAYMDNLSVEETKARYGANTRVKDSCSRKP